MLVSIIIPAFNAERFILETVNSVLSQTYRSLELIVVDDGSSDHTASIVRELQGRDGRISLYNQDNQGSAAARNSGIAHSNGELIAFLDADDLWHSTKLEKQVDVFKRDPTIGLVYTWCRMIDTNGMIDGATGASHTVKGYAFNRLLIENFVANGSVAMVRRDCLPPPTPIDPELKGNEDSYFYLRISAHHKVDFVPEYLVGYRWNTGANISSNLQVQHQSHTLFIKKVLKEYPQTSLRLIKWSAAGLRFGQAQVAAKKGDVRTAVALTTAALQQSWTFIFSPFFRRTMRLTLRYAYRRISGAAQDRRHFLQANPKAW